jgi:hypothetical protein
MSQSFTRILDNQSNKLLANLPSIEINGPIQSAPIQTFPIQTLSGNFQVPLSQVQLGEGMHDCKFIKLFGFEFTIYTLILILVLLVCVGYFLYKYFFTQTDVVIYKKNIKKESKKNKVNNKEEYSNNSDISNILGSSNNSSSAQTLDM